MKKYFGVLMIIYVFAFVSCSKGKNDEVTDAVTSSNREEIVTQFPSESPGSDDVDTHIIIDVSDSDDIDVKLTQKDDYYVLRIKNNLDKEIGYGNSFYVEKQQDTGWNLADTVKQDGYEETFTDEGYILKPGEVVELEINMAFLYDVSQIGKYRLIKKFSGNIGETERMIYTKYIEFEVVTDK